MKKHRRQHTLAIFQNIIVPKTQDVKTIQFKRSRSHLVIADAIRMLTSVELDDKVFFKAYKIRDEPKQRKLATEFAPGQLSSTKAIPQQPLRIRRGPAQVSRQIRMSPFLHAPPSPAPSARPLPPAGEVFISVSRAAAR